MELAQERIYKLEDNLAIYSEDNNPVWEGKTNKDKENLTASEDEADDQPSQIAHTDHRTLRSWKGGGQKKHFKKSTLITSPNWWKTLIYTSKKFNRIKVEKKKLRYTPRYIHPKGDAKGECKT